MSNYKPEREYYVTLKDSRDYYRYLKIEQGRDNSLYIKHQLALAKSKDGNYPERSYVSYHANYNKEKGGYKVHQYGCGGNRIEPSERYSPIFAPVEAYREFIRISIGRKEHELKINTTTNEDLVFNLPKSFSNYEFVFFSQRGWKLAEDKDIFLLAKKIVLNDYDVICTICEKDLS
ncbi:MAG: hypothetical protein ACOC5T_01875 [Elusimicrobiota bacterium]